MPSIKENSQKALEEIDTPFSSSDPSHLSEEALFEIIAQSPFFKKKHQEAEEALLKVDWSQISKKS
ncbi:hypothetical protein [Dyadobacter pollutisoli]|jgi:hypothetical protein|uniref:Uncharacterized protein n=1 Tax=Dyadobacter pollutisoli TaxID=2910158 RepID=A0A9E8N7N1_9BACT|nr:hypothetical protein [Dyadobacter pollutisoli]WAC09414.1 hypothetical protein ON006_16820 [Dyadobacter pollutisoli]